MSLRIHCDYCDEYVYRTTSGDNEIHFSLYSKNTLGKQYVFCDEECLHGFVRSQILGEHVEPKLVEVPM